MLVILGSYIQLKILMLEILQEERHTVDKTQTKIFQNPSKFCTHSHILKFYLLFVMHFLYIKKFLKSSQYADKYWNNIKLK